MQTHSTILSLKLSRKIGLVVLCLAIALGLYVGPSAWKEANRPCRALDDLFGRTGCIAEVAFQDILIPLGSRLRFMDRDTVRVVGVERRDGKQRPVLVELSMPDARIVSRAPTELWLADGPLSAIISPSGNKVLLTVKYEKKLPGILLFDWDGTFIAVLGGSGSMSLPRAYFLSPEASLSFEDGIVRHRASIADGDRTPPVWSLEDGRLMEGLEPDFPGQGLWPSEQGTFIVWAGADHSLAVSRRPKFNREKGYDEAQLFSVDHETGRHTPLGVLIGGNGDVFFGDASSGGNFLAFETKGGKKGWGAAVAKTTDTSETWSRRTDRLFSA